MRSLYLLLDETFLKLDFLELYAKLTAVLLTFLAIIFVAVVELNLLWRWVRDIRVLYNMVAIIFEPIIYKN